MAYVDGCFLKVKLLNWLTATKFVVLIPFQHGLTAVHIACKKGRKDIVCELVEKARTQKNFCFKREMSSDYEVAMSAKGRDVCK